MTAARQRVSPNAAVKDSPIFEGFMTLREAEERGWPSRFTLRRNILSGHIPHLRNGNRYLVHEDDLRKWVSRAAVSEAPSLEEVIELLEKVWPTLSPQHQCSYADMLKNRYTIDDEVNDSTD